jgi:hypothetical protein
MARGETEVNQMKVKAKRILAVAVFVVLLGGGIGYVTGVLPPWRTASDSKAKAPESPLRIEGWRTAAFGETGVEGHRDFRLQNQANKALTIQLISADCECARVSACLAPDDWKKLDAKEFLKRADEPTLDWKTLKSGGESLVVPPVANGLIRVKWKALKVGSSSIGISLSVEDGQQAISQRFEVPVKFIEPVILCAESDLKEREADVGHLKRGAEQTAKLLCYSTTRKKFTIAPVQAGGDPCIQCGAPQLLTQEEVQALPKAPDGDPVLSAYRVKITVKERTNGKQLDIGPFYQVITFTTDVSSDLKVNAAVKGTVDGEIGLADAEGKDFVDLGLVIPSKPQPVTFTLRSRDPEMQLTLDEKRTVDFLQVELPDGKEGKLDGNERKWQVRAMLRTDTMFRGPIPNPNSAGYTTAVDCSVVFLLSRSGKTDSPPRRLLIPVRGTVRVY